jgi:uncharacterized repeat protein (TIGR01451 family)
VWKVGKVTTTAATDSAGEGDGRLAERADQHGDDLQVEAVRPGLGNNTASATETPQRADLALTKTVTDATPNVGDTISFSVTLSNNGPDAATNVQVTDLLPAGLTFVSATPSQGAYNSASGVWTVGTVTAGTPQTLLVQATVVASSTKMNTTSISHADQFRRRTPGTTAPAPL